MADKAAEKAAQEAAAAQREDYLRALGEELEGYKRAGNEDRAADVEAEIKRVKGAPRSRAAQADTQNA